MQKLKKEMVETTVIEDVICDFCKVSCKKEMNIEAAYLTTSWGYESKKDMDHRQYEICEGCFDKIIEHFKVHPDAGLNLPWEV